MDKFNKGQMSYEIKEIIGPISTLSESNNWCKAVLTSICNGVEMVDIRRVEIEKKMASKGISLTKTEADNLVDLLLSQGYGSYESIKTALDDKEKVFKGDK